MAERKRNEKGRCASQEGGADSLTKAVGGFVQHRRNGDALRIRANLDGDFAARAPKSSCFWTIASHFVVLCHVSRHDKKKLIHFFILTSESIVRHFIASQLPRACAYVTLRLHRKKTEKSNGHSRNVHSVSAPAS